MANVIAQKKNLRGDALFNDLISYWRLNEASGTRYDSYGSNHLTDNNTVTRATGKQSGAASFTAANSEYLNIASNPSLQTGDIDFTICGWIYPLSLTASGNDIVTKILIGASSGFEYFIQAYTDGSNFFRFRYGAGDIYASEAGVQLNQWAFFVCWHDSVANTVNYQINNGTIRSVSYSGGVTANNETFNIGMGTLDRYFNGYIDEVGFWKRVLTQGERTRLYNSGFGLTIPFDPLSDRLVSSWKLNEASGTRADSIGGNTLSDNNTVTRALGKQSGAAQFTLANSESLNYSSSTPFSFGDSDFTIACWVYLDSKPAGPNSMLIVTKYQSDTVRDFLLQYVGSAQDFRFIVYDGTANPAVGTVSTGSAVNITQWYFVVAYHSKTTNSVGISVNGGTPVVATRTGTPAATASLLYIGNREGAASFPWDGRMDEICIWKRVLSQSEIKKLYNNGYGLSFPFNSLQDRLVSYWKLDETSGTRSDSNLANNLGDNNTVAYTTGKVSNAADFTAANSEYLNVASNVTLTTGDIDFTYACWVNLRAKNFLDYQIVLSKRNGGTNEREITVDFDRVADRFRASISSNGTSSTTVSANNFGSPNINTWYFLMVWYDSGADTINISINNGTPNSAAHSGGAYVGTAQFCLGAGNATADTFLDGYLDEVGFWKRLLTPDEKAKLYQSFQATSYPFK